MKAQFICGPEGLGGFLIPMIQAEVPAGIPEEQYEVAVSRTALFEAIVRHPDNTFVLRAKGDSMTGAGIESGDYLIVDRAIRRGDDSIIIAEIDGEYTVKRFERRDGRLQLVSANPNHQPISIQDYQTVRAWGVVTFVIKPLCGLSPPPRLKPNF
jgi:DNA polymerase V